MNSYNPEHPIGSKTILSAWNRLHEIRSLTFDAYSHQGNTGWCGKGEGDIQVELTDSDTILFHEQGIWNSETNQSLAFHNLYRWKLIESTGMIRLDHLRFGIDRPVFLFELQRKAETKLEPANPHICGDDLYFATMNIHPDSLGLAWSVKGPKKDEEIRYLYH